MMLSEKDKKAVLEDFTTWNGGYPPHEAASEITLYVEVAMDHRLDDEDVADYLWELANKEPV